MIGLAIAQGLVVADLVYPNAGAALCCFERAAATQISGVCERQPCRRSGTDAPPRGEQQLPKGKWVIDSVLC